MVYFEVNIVSRAVDIVSRVVNIAFRVVNIAFRVVNIVSLAVNIVFINFYFALNFIDTDSLVSILIKNKVLILVLVSLLCSFVHFVL